MNAEVTYKKERGTLKIDDKQMQLIYKPYKAGGATVAVAIADIKMQMRAPGKPLVKILLKSGEKDVTFRFHYDLSAASRDASPEAEMAVREAFINAVAQLTASISDDLPPPRIVSREELQQRMDALQANQELRRLHAALVIQSKLLTEEEFWSLPGRQQLLSTSAQERN